jgi:putative spermidine/putrescine transport system permease protein
MGPSAALPHAALSATCTKTPRHSGFFVALLLAPTLLLLIAFFVVPLYYMVSYSFSRYDPLLLVVRAFSFENYAKFLTDPYTRGILLRTIRVASLTTVFTLLLGYPLAYYITRARGLEKTLLILLVLWPLMISPVILAYGWFVLLAPNSGALSNVMQWSGLLTGPLVFMRTEPGMVLGLTHECLAFMVLNLHSALESIDSSHLRAASILGATPTQTFYKVTLPLSLPGIFSGSLLVFAISSSAFIIPYVFGGQRLPVMAVYAYTLNVTILNWPLGAATGIILVIISLVLISLFGSYVTRLRRKLGMA